MLGGLRLRDRVACLSVALVMPVRTRVFWGGGGGRGLPEGRPRGTSRNLGVFFGVSSVISRARVVVAAWTRAVAGTPARGAPWWAPRRGSLWRVGAVVRVRPRPRPRGCASCFVAGTLLWGGTMAVCRARAGARAWVRCLCARRVGVRGARACSGVALSVAVVPLSAWCAVRCGDRARRLVCRVLAVLRSLTRVSWWWGVGAGAGGCCGRRLCRLRVTARWWRLAVGCAQVRRRRSSRARVSASAVGASGVRGVLAASSRAVRLRVVSVRAVLLGRPSSAVRRP